MTGVRSLVGHDDVGLVWFEQVEEPLGDDDAAAWSGERDGERAVVGDDLDVAGVVASAQVSVVAQHLDGPDAADGDGEDCGDAEPGWDGVVDPDGVGAPPYGGAEHRDVSEVGDRQCGEARHDRAEHGDERERRGSGRQVGRDPAMRGGDGGDDGAGDDQRGEQDDGIHGVSSRSVRRVRASRSDSPSTNRDSTLAGSVAPASTSSMRRTASSDSSIAAA